MREAQEAAWEGEVSEIGQDVAPETVLDEIEARQDKDAAGKPA